MADLFTHDDLSDQHKTLIDEAKENVRRDNASALSAVRKLLAVATGFPTPMFTTAELRGLNLAYPLMRPPEARSTVESYAGRAYQDATVSMGALATLGSVEPALMRGKIDASLQKTIAHALVVLEASDYADAIQEDNDPVAAATQSWHAPTIGGGELKPVEVGPSNQSPIETAKAEGNAPKEASSGGKAGKSDDNRL